jgi:hypothetical protein
MQFFIQIVVFNNLGSACLLALGEYELSYQDAVKSLEINPKLTNGFYRAALSCFYKGDYTNAMEYLDCCKESLSEPELVSLRAAIVSKKN